MYNDIEVKTIEKIDDLPGKYKKFKISDRSKRGELAQIEGGDTIVVVYETANGQKAYLFDHIQFNSEYQRKMHENALMDNNKIVVIFQIKNYSSKL